MRALQARARGVICFATVTKTCAAAVAARRLPQERIKPRGAERDVIRLSEIALDDGRPMLQRARSEGWEGLIVKNAQSMYHSGKRTPA
jgi:hypothetical protein